MKAVALLGLAVICASLSGCVHVPPSMVTRDRFDYGEAIADSWKQQTLMNVVRIRYADAPVFLDVSSVINSYTLSGSVGATASVGESPARNVYGATAGGSWSNTPTVTYQPLMGDKFSKSLLTPIPPIAVLQLMQAGWEAEWILPVTLRNVNGLHSQSKARAADPEFNQFVNAMGRIQRSAEVGFRLEKGKEGDALFLLIDRKHAGVGNGDSQGVRELLGLDPAATEFNVTYGAVPRNNHEVAMLTRSMFEIIIELGWGIEAPEKDLRDQSAVSTVDGLQEPRGVVQPMVKIHSGGAAPSHAYASVRYRDSWFWIDDQDVPSKQTFTLLMILFSLAETGQAPAAPLLTVSTGR